MELTKVIAMRKSTRSYRKEQISNESLMDIINAGYAAPVGNGKYDTVHLTHYMVHQLLCWFPVCQTNRFPMLNWQMQLV